jgi:hypothetical protein
MFPVHTPIDYIENCGEQQGNRTKSFETRKKKITPSADERTFSVGSFIYRKF